MKRVKSNNWHRTIAIQVTVCGLSGLGLFGLAAADPPALVGDGKTLVTAPVQQRIDACHAAGGGRVCFPPGRYLIGSLELKDHVYLELSAGAVLLGSRNMADYTRPALIYANGARNFGILGRGTIDGNGESFWKGKSKPLVRPDRLLLLEDCSQIRIQDVTLLNSPNWNLELLRCDHAWIDGVTINSPRQAPNTDGIDPNSSSNIFISNCHIDTGDDAICLKSVGERPTENIVVQNCVLISDDSAIKIGTRTEAPIRHALFNNIVIRNSRYGIAFYAKDGGNCEDIRFSNILIETEGEAKFDPDRPGSTYALFLDVERRNTSGPVSRIQDIYFNSISIKSFNARCAIQGLPEQPIRRLRLDNITYTQQRHSTFEGSVKPRGVSSLSSQTRNDFTHVPANFTFAYVDGLNISGLAVHDVDESGVHERHALWGTRLANVHLDRVSVQHARGKQTAQSHRAGQRTGSANHELECHIFVTPAAQPEWS